VLVFTVLTLPTFESLGRAELKYVSIKALFLILIACSKRGNHVYHLDATQISFAEHNREVSIGVLPEYVSKREAEYNRPFDKNIVFSALNLPTDKEDKSLCPVRALSFYLKATKGHRRGRKRLFLPIPKGKEDFRECALTYWARQLIIRAYRDCPDEVAVLHRPLHETRTILSLGLCLRMCICPVCSSSRMEPIMCSLVPT
jgi:hypothetical protein